MSKLGYCEQGGQGGIKVTTRELAAFARKKGRKAIDEIIPLPKDFNQGKKCDIDHEDIDAMMEHQVYWETETGSHGWCCDSCGEVTQWG